MKNQSGVKELWVWTMASLILFVLSCDIVSGDKTDSQKPNFILLFADDMTFDAINALGHDVIETPNLDKLVERGTLFSNAYNMGGWNGAVCIASRAMLNTGRSIWRAQEFMRAWSKGDSSTIDRTWASLLRQAGYRTYMTGKWHLPIPPDMVFDEARHVRPGMPPDAGFFRPLNNWRKEGKTKTWAEIMPPGYNRPLSEQDKTWSPSDTSFGGFWSGGKHWSEVVRDDGIDFLKEAANQENPFFMYLAFNAPHDPRQSPASYVNQYPVEKIALPPNWSALYGDRDSIGCGRTLRDEALAPFPRTEYATKIHMQEYYAIISHMDHQIGQILETVDALELSNDTYIIFTSDHGLAVGQHGLLGKQNMYEHSMKVPLILVGPRFEAKKTINKPVYFQNIMPTTLDLANIDIPADIDFESLLYDSDHTESIYNNIYGCYIDHQRMIKANEMKLIVYPRLNKLKLFNLKSDPYEIDDLSGDPEQQPVIKEMFKELIAMQVELDDQLDLNAMYTTLLAHEK